VLPAAAQHRTVAITFDDLPAIGARDADDAEQINRNIIAALDQHHAPATAFVNEKGIQALGVERARDVLRLWTASGRDLANHTFSHADFNNLAIKQFENEVTTGEPSIAAVMKESGKTVRYFRFPFNHAGDTRAKHDAALEFLAARKYQIAVCTIDNTDWEFARAYDIMRRENRQDDADRLGKEYVEYSAKEIAYYTELHKKIFGRETPHVMLLHANHVNSDLLDRVLSAFEAQGYQFVTLDAAESDAIYQAPDTYVSSYGPMWGYRWAKQLGVKVDGKLEPEPQQWILSYGKTKQ